MNMLCAVQMLEKPRTLNATIAKCETPPPPERKMYTTNPTYTLLP